MRRLQFYDEAPKLPIQVGEVLEPNPGCERCALHKTARSVCIPPAMEPGEGDDVLLVVFDDPGATEDVAGQPAVGNTGRYVRGLIRRWWKGPVLYTHALACYSGKIRTGVSHINHCRPYLRQVDEDLKPARILCLGAIASRAVGGQGLPPFSTRGAYGHLSDGRLAFYLMNPNSTHRNSFVRRWFEEDVERALTFDPVRAPWYGAAMLIETQQDAVDALNTIRDELDYAVVPTPLAVDIEGYGELGDVDQRILTIGLSVGQDQAWVWDEGVIGELFGNPLVDPVIELLLDPKVPKSGHNAKYDWEKLELLLNARPVGFSSCTRIHRKLIQADSYAKLKDLQTLLGMGGWKDAGQGASDAAVKHMELQIQRSAADLELTQAIRAGAAASSVKAVEKRRDKLVKQVHASSGWQGSSVDLMNAMHRVRTCREPEAYSMAGIDPVTRARYCGMDAASQHALAMVFERQVRDEPGLQMAWEEVHRPFHRAVEAMERIGLLIDAGNLQQLQLHLNMQIQQKSQRIVELAGPEFNANSPKMVSDKLVDLGASLRRTTASGALSVDREVLEDVAKDGGAAGELAEAIVDYRRATKFKSTYADAVEQHIRDDGCVHANIMIDGTESGRPSSSGPNVFNFPRPKSMDGKLCRNLIVSPPGWWLYEFDQSQVEFRKAGILSGDPVMLSMFNQGIDFHLATAKLIAPMLGVDPNDVDKDHVLRDRAKTLNFAILYGDPPEGTAFKLNISVQEAKRLRAAVLGQFTVLAAWIENQVKEARRTGQCRVYWRGEPALIRPLWQIADADEDARKTAERSSYNTPVQGSAALITNASCGAVQQWIDDGYRHAKLILTIYDSLLLLVREFHEREVYEKVEQICTQWHPLLKVDAKRGRSWGAMESIELSDL